MVQRHVPPGALMTAESHDLLSKITNAGCRNPAHHRRLSGFSGAPGWASQPRESSTDLNEIARDASESNQEYAAGKGVGLSLDLSNGLPSIEADAARLTQVVRNFVSNAIKFGIERIQRNHSDSSRSGFVRLEVSDSGPGLTEEDLNKVFHKYARLSNKPTGGEKSSGLGLAICKQMIDLHGGEIGVFNNSDKGRHLLVPPPGRSAQAIS